MNDDEQGSGPVPEAAPGRRRVQTRDVPDWEYWTAYVWKFQIRVTPAFHQRLSELATREGRTLEDLVAALLEEQAARRAAAAGR